MESKRPDNLLADLTNVFVDARLFFDNLCTDDQMTRMAAMHVSEELDRIESRIVHQLCDDTPILEE